MSISIGPVYTVKFGYTANALKLTETNIVNKPYKNISHFSMLLQQAFYM